MTQHQEIPIESILAILIDRAGGTITLSKQELHRIADMNPEIQFSTVEDFSDNALQIRYQANVTIEGQLAPNMAGDTECEVSQ